MKTKEIIHRENENIQKKLRRKKLSTFRGFKHYKVCNYLDGFK